MASATSQGFKLLHGFKKLNRFDKGLGSKLPDAYKKFWKEWKLGKPTAVHYIPKEGRWERDVVTGEVKPVQNIPLPLIHPPEADLGIWGGEAVIKGFKKRNPVKSRFPKFWVPVLRRSVVYSAVLNQHMSMIVTDRTINLINESCGFDHYLLKTLACDLRSTLALNLKRKILQALKAGCPNLAHDPLKQQKILNEYKQYLDQYTEEEIEWYGLTYLEAIKKLQNEIEKENPVVPEKLEFRNQLIEQLKKEKLAAVEEGDEGSTKRLSTHLGESSSWLSKMNPFGKKQET